MPSQLAPAVNEDQTGNPLHLMPGSASLAVGYKVLLEHSRPVKLGSKQYNERKEILTMDIGTVWQKAGEKQS
jgi:hypothetical protein